LSVVPCSVALGGRQVGPVDGSAAGRRLLAALRVWSRPAWPFRVSLAGLRAGPADALHSAPRSGVCSLLGQGDCLARVAHSGAEHFEAARVGSPLSVLAQRQPVSAQPPGRSLRELPTVQKPAVSAALAPLTAVSLH
jgi:hypothetical protein